MNKSIVMNSAQCGWSETHKWWVLDLLIEEWVEDEIDFILGVGRYAS